MIIKSMSRKQPSFRQLIDYMNKDKSKEAIFHNFYATDRTTTEEIITEFEKNSALLSKRKNGNYLYHEILSLELPYIESEKLDNALIHISEMYLEERAKHQLAYAVIHKDTDNLHIHFCISANNIDEPTRVRLSKSTFSKIQKNLENYVLQEYPELGQSKIYNQDYNNKEQLKTTSREQEFKKRTKKISKKEELKNTLHGCFELANSQNELITVLNDKGFSLYTRGKTIGIENTETGRKYRFKTLGVLEHYHSSLERYSFQIQYQEQATEYGIDQEEENRVVSPPEKTQETKPDSEEKREEKGTDARVNSKDNTKTTTSQKRKKAKTSGQPKKKKQQPSYTKKSTIKKEPKKAQPSKENTAMPDKQDDEQKPKKSAVKYYYNLFVRGKTETEQEQEEQERKDAVRGKPKSLKSEKRGKDQHEKDRDTREKRRDEKLDELNRISKKNQKNRDRER